MTLSLEVELSLGVRGQAPKAGTPHLGVKRGLGLSGEHGRQGGGRNMGRDARAGPVVSVRWRREGANAGGGQGPEGCGWGLTFIIQMTGGPWRPRDRGVRWSDLNCSQISARSEADVGGGRREAERQREQRGSTWIHRPQINYTLTSNFPVGRPGARCPPK